MRKYEISLPFEIKDCLNCVYVDRYERSQRVSLEHSQMSGVVEIRHLISTCRLSGKPLNGGAIKVNSPECGMNCGEQNE